MSQMYRFEWRPVNRDDELNSVESYDRDMMNMFLQQHGFDPQNANVFVVDDDHVDDSALLRPFTFGSRKRNGFFRIITTSEIVSGIAEIVADELSDCMTLGPCALRTEIQLFKHINDLIDGLSFIYVLEGTLADDSSTDDYDYRDEYPYYESIAMNKDLSYLFDSLCTESHYSRPVQPITIESYVSIFAKSFLIGY